MDRARRRCLRQTLRRDRLSSRPWAGSDKGRAVQVVTGWLRGGYEVVTGVVTRWLRGCPGGNEMRRPASSCVQGTRARRSHRRRAHALHMLHPLHAAANRRRAQAEGGSAHAGDYWPPRQIDCNSAGTCTFHSMTSTSASPTARCALRSARIRRKSRVASNADGVRSSSMNERSAASASGSASA